MDALRTLLAAGLTARVGPTGQLLVGPQPRLTDDLRALVRAHRDELVGQVRAADQDEVGLLELLEEMVEDVAAVDADRAARLRDHIGSLLRTDLETARGEVAYCWTALIRCEIPALPEAQR